MVEANRIAELIAARNYGGAWQAAEDSTGEQMTYVEFLRRYVWTQSVEGSGTMDSGIAYVRMAESAFDNRRMDYRFQPRTAVALTDEFGDTLCYAYTDDGEGFFFYDSKNELENNHA